MSETWKTTASEQRQNLREGILSDANDRKQREACLDLLLQLVKADLPDEHPMTLHFDDEA
jgi:Ser/Thr protein kinase RdoA (MazF antagonist)